MPRRNKTAVVKRADFTTLTHTKQKTAYKSKSEAERAIQNVARYTFDVQLHAYQSPTDGKWYLSSSKGNRAKN